MKRLVVYLFLVFCILNISVVYAKVNNSLAPPTALLKKESFRRQYSLFVNTSFPKSEEDLLENLFVKKSPKKMHSAAENEDEKNLELLSPYTQEEIAVAVDQAFREILFNFKKHGLILEIPENLSLKLHLIFNNPDIDIKKIAKQIVTAV